MEDEIKKRAYLLWIKEGCPEGKDLEHWLAAEKEVKKENKIVCTSHNYIKVTSDPYINSLTQGLDEYWCSKDELNALKYSDYSSQEMIEAGQQMLHDYYFQNSRTNIFGQRSCPIPLFSDEDYLHYLKMQRVKK